MEEIEEITTVENYKKDFAKRLRHFLERYEITPKELAYESCKSIDVVYKYLEGKTIPGTKSFLDMLSYIGITPEIFWSTIV